MHGLQARFLFLTLRTVHVWLYCYPTTVPGGLGRKWGIYHIVGRALLFPAVISPCPVSLAAACTTVSTSRLSSDSRAPRFYFSAGNGQWPISDEFPWFSQNQCRFFNYHTIRNGNLFPDWASHIWHER